MRLPDWLRSGDLQRQPATREEIERFFGIAARDLGDCEVAGVSRDRQFAIAYEAALTLAMVVLRAADYRLRGSSAGHHWLTFALLPEIMGPQAEARSRYYQACRRKRHQATYERTGVTSEAELAELVSDVQAFRRELIAWLRARHPEVLPHQADQS